MQNNSSLSYLMRSSAKPKRQIMLKPVKETWRRIHQAIHDGSMFVTIDNKPVKVGKSGKGLRYVLYSDMELGPCTFMEQNKEKQSEYAERARNGETLTWVMPQNTAKSWKLIDLPVQKEVTNG